MVSVDFVASVAGNRLDSEFLPQINKLRHVPQPKIIALVHSPG
jgi:hypothetical protein